jgi:hypothetical protein
MEDRWVLGRRERESKWPLVAARRRVGCCHTVTGHCPNALRPQFSQMRIFLFRSLVFVKKKISSRENTFFKDVNIKIASVMCKNTLKLLLFVKEYMYFMADNMKHG